MGRPSVVSRDPVTYADGRNRGKTVFVVVREDSKFYELGVHVVGQR